MEPTCARPPSETCCATWRMFHSSSTGIGIDASILLVVVFAYVQICTRCSCIRTVQAYRHMHIHVCHFILFTLVRQVDRQVDDRQTDRLTHRQQTDRQIKRLIERQVDRQVDRQISRQTDRWIDRETDRQNERQTNRQKRVAVWPRWLGLWH